MRAVGGAVTWTEAPDWSSYEAETGFNMILGSSLWTVDGTWPDVQHSTPVEISHRLAAGDVAARVSVRHIYALDMPFPDAGWFNSISLTLDLPLPTAPAADTAALRLQSRGGVTAPLSNAEGGVIEVTVGASHNGEIVDGWLYSTPTYLGQAVVANGVAKFTLPAGMTGSHTIAVANSSGTLIGWAPVMIQAAGGSSGKVLALTGGGSPTLLGGLGALTLLGGGMLLLRASRRRLTA